MEALLWKLGNSLWVGLMMGGMMSIFATLILVRVRAANTLKQATRMGIAAGAVIGVLFVGISLFT